MCSVVFFGTDEFAAYILEKLLDNGIDVKAVVTKPDRAKQRNKQLLPTKVKEMLLFKDSSIPLHQVEKASTPEFADTLRGYSPDLFVVVSYGEIISEELLAIPKILPINIHPSLLPKYRGASPLRSALLAGDKEIGVAIIEMVKAMDAGDILALERLEVFEGENHSMLQERVFEKSSQMLLKLIDEVSKGVIHKVKQAGEVTFTKKFSKEDTRIDWNEHVSKIAAKINAFGDTPGAFCTIKLGATSLMLKITKAKVHFEPSCTFFGTKTFSKFEGWNVLCNGGMLQILQVQKENKKLMEVQDFINGTHQQAPLIVLT